MGPERVEQIRSSKRPVQVPWYLVDAVEIVTANGNSKIALE